MFGAAWSDFDVGFAYVVLRGGFGFKFSDVTATGVPTAEFVRADDGGVRALFGQDRIGPARRPQPRELSALSHEAASPRWRRDFGVVAPM